jgi:hypothetical protein
MSIKISALNPKSADSAAGDLFETTSSGITYSVTTTEITAIEATTRAAADVVLQGNINTETTNRTNADAAIIATIATKIESNGTVTFIANQPMGGFKLTGLGAATTAGDAVRYQQAILITGVNDWTANQSLGGFKITNSAAPSAGGDLANKTYVDLMLPKTGGTMSGVIAMGTNKITGMGDPTLAQDAVTLIYLQANSWNLAGNAPGNDTSFIGTTDNHDFLIKTNNISIGKITKAGLYGFGSLSTTPAATVDITGVIDIADSIIVRSKGSGVPIVQTGIKFYNWVNSGANNFSGRIYATFDSVSTGSERISVATADAVDQISIKEGGVKIHNHLTTSKSVLLNHTAVAINASGASLVTVNSGLVAGCISSTSAAATLIILDSVANIINAFATAGMTVTTDSVITFFVDNSQGTNTVTIQVDAGATIAVATSALTGGNTLTVSTANKVALFSLFITSATTGILSRII